MVFRRLFLLLFICVSTLRLFSQGEISLKIEPDTNIIRIGEQINFTVELKHPNNLSIAFPNYSDFIDPKLEIMDISPIDTLSKSNLGTYVKQSFKITSFDTGFYQIPSMPFEINFNNRIDTLFSYKIPIGVFTMKLDTTNNIFDIKPQYNMKFKLSEILTQKWIYYILLAVLVTIILIFYFIKKRKNKINPEYNKPKIPAHVLAIKELDVLKAEKLWQQNLTKEFYSRLTNIIRNYIELRFNVMALEKTSTEIIREFENKKLIDESMLNHLTGLLSLADLVKFAKGTALPDENEKNMESAYDFVRKTKLVASIVQDNPEDKEINNVEPVKE